MQRRQTHKHSNDTHGNFKMPGMYCRCTSQKYDGIPFSMIWFWFQHHALSNLHCVLSATLCSCENWYVQIKPWIPNLKWCSHENGHVHVIRVHRKVSASRKASSQGSISAVADVSPPLIGHFQYPQSSAPWKWLFSQAGLSTVSVIKPYSWSKVMVIVQSDQTKELTLSQCQ